jgi:O-6-methylguanine DNA methyltransferase
VTRLAWIAVPAPWGPILLAAGPSGLIELDLMADEEAFRAAIHRRFPGAELRAAEDDGPGAALARRAAGAVEQFVAGEPVPLDLPVDLADRPAWDRAVLAAVAGIPRGETASYGEIARRIGRRGAARAVGGAVSRNPVGLVIPCHRVIAGDGTLGGYGGDRWGSREVRLAVKRELLELEGAWPTAGSAAGPPAPVPRVSHAGARDTRPHPADAR